MAEGFENDERREGLDRPAGGDSSEEPTGVDRSGSSEPSIAGGLTGRLRDVFRGEPEADLLLDRAEVETGILRWLRALDLHIPGACRAEERLKPLFKLNLSGGVAEDLLLAQLSQHFEASEVGMLARCLCVPLVSIRIGKVNKQGNLLCPTTARGHLNLALLPSSNMRLSFIGDDGCTERLAVIRKDIDCSEVVIEEIQADTSGRSFLIRLPGLHVFYFWCSEKSITHGLELVAKMKDLLRRKPTLSNLTGICESRLESFAIHLRTYLLGSSISAETESVPPLGGAPATAHSGSYDVHSTSSVLKSSSHDVRTSLTLKGDSLHRDSLSPRLGTFKDCTTRRHGIREKFRQLRGDGNSALSIDSQLDASVSSHAEADGRREEDVVRGSDGPDSLPSIFPQPEICSISSSFPLPIPLLLSHPPLERGASKSMFSPYYCWCPPCPSSLQYSMTPSHPRGPRLPIAYEDTVPLPPLSSLLPSGLPVPPVTSSPLFDVSKLPPLSLPSFHSEPSVRLPLPVNSLATLPTSHQISTFTPFIMSDPIVHTPVIDVCSSGQGYLVSAGPAISSAVPSLLPSFVKCPLIPNTESAVEKSARETLQMLMASAPPSNCLKATGVFPPFTDKLDGTFLDAPVFGLGNHGLNNGILDFDDAVSTKHQSLSSATATGEAMMDDGEMSEVGTSNIAECQPSGYQHSGVCDSGDCLLDRPEPH